MKKNVIILSFILLFIILICIVGIQVNSKMNNGIKQQNRQYEQYLNSEIYGTDVVTLINKATSNNETNDVAKDQKGFYINNEKNSIMIELIMITNEEKEETTTYKMETISKVGITEFIKNFNTTKFKCTNKTYHKETGQIAYIELTQQSNWIYFVN